MAYQNPKICKDRKESERGILTCALGKPTVRGDQKRVVYVAIFRIDKGPKDLSKPSGVFLHSQPSDFENPETLKTPPGVVPKPTMYCSTRRERKHREEEKHRRERELTDAILWTRPTVRLSCASTSSDASTPRPFSRFL